MPELPEVETIVRELRRALKGSRIKALKLRKRGVFLSARGLSARSLDGKRVKAVRRRGKYIILDLSADLSLLIHLRMTGRLLLCAQHTSDERLATLRLAVSAGSESQTARSGRKGPEGNRRASDKHSHCVFTLNRNRTLTFNDTRRFGRINLMKTSSLAPYFAARLGPEPFDMTAQDFLRAAQGRRGRAKAFIMDQKNIAGVGNIYADESLYRARIHPATRLDKLSEKKLAVLHRAVLRVLKEAIKGQGTTVADFRRSGGETGLFQNKLRVYGHAGYKCRRCRDEISYMKLGGRGTYYCPRCQPY